ncbi:MAG: endonuclease [Clostridia bacterium]|nr:endonuclease [Clostridia bacterium]
MKNFKRISAALLLVFALIITALPFSTPASAATLVYSKESNSGTRDVVCITLEGTGASKYYTGNYTYDKLDDLSEDALFDALQELMTETHTYLSTYNDCHYKADLTDCEENNGKVTLIYTSYQATMAQWNGWNREHVWPKSLGGKDDKDRTGGADMHHIRPSDKGVNSSRGNKKYGNSNGGNKKYGTDPAVGVLGGTYNNTYFEPNDNVKGDVARICLYMYVRWNSDWGCDSLNKVFESVEVLLEWCELDPVDTWEMGRNEVIGAIQGNRNVFIDYPELAWLMLGYDIPEGMTTPSGKASAGDPSCKHTSTEIKNKSDATCGKDGYTGDTHCKDCGKKMSTGTVIKATGNHKFGSWTTVNGKQTRTCSVCKTVETKNCEHKNTEIRNALSPTCAKEGYSGDTYCKDCNTKTASGAKIDPTNEHNYEVWKTEGNKQISSCTVCGNAGERPIPECDHLTSEVVGALSPTCGGEGYTGDTCCKDCGALIASGTSIPATGEHKNTVLQNEKKPTCGEGGYSGDTYCNDCKKVVKQGNELPETGEHFLVEGEIISEPTKDKDGLRMDKCVNCGYVEGVVLPKTGSDNTAVIIIIAVVAAVALVAVVITVIVVKKKKAK